MESQTYQNEFPALSFTCCTLKYVMDAPRPPLINPPPINYSGKFPTRINVLKQYTYADFLSSCKEANKLCFVKYLS